MLLTSFLPFSFASNASWLIDITAVEGVRGQRSTLKFKLGHPLAVSGNTIKSQNCHTDSDQRSMLIQVQARLWRLTLLPPGYPEALQIGVLIYAPEQQLNAVRTCFSCPQVELRPDLQLNSTATRSLIYSILGRDIATLSPLPIMTSAARPSTVDADQMDHPIKSSLRLDRAVKDPVHDYSALSQLYNCSVYIDFCGLTCDPVSVSISPRVGEFVDTSVFIWSYHSCVRMFIIILHPQETVPTTQIHKTTWDFLLYLAWGVA